MSGENGDGENRRTTFDGGPCAGFKDQCGALRFEYLVLAPSGLNDVSPNGYAFMVLTYTDGAVTEVQFRTASTLTELMVEAIRADGRDCCPPPRVAELVQLFEEARAAVAASDARTAPVAPVGALS